jgi:hypothetical protein
MPKAKVFADNGRRSAVGRTEAHGDSLLEPIRFLPLITPLERQARLIAICRERLSSSAIRPKFRRRQSKRS